MVKLPTEPTSSTFPIFVSAEDWFFLPNRGWAAVVPCPFNWNKDEFSFLGKRIVIDGRYYTVLGIESFAMPRIHSGTPISVLVGEP